jgi:hypothetical protein
MHNNPALGLFLLASLGGYGFNWPRGKDELLITSVGTGQIKEKLNPRTMAFKNPLSLGIAALKSLMYDSDMHAQTLLQSMGHSLTNWHIDSLIEDVRHDQLAAGALFSYARYNILGPIGG